ncbi:hypothetical protein BCR43DRAFT_488020 [Syncephalastrum racemosum]|uniref:MARVEL domain-containing protein n=1 Tax=Syncephalastrum racemosum TaxID=13706 RepID=A0A1X2HI29_SYNRA|nr:hypothetical protein BCR43DRAFT_488020 [Syncephalastrum racemosum]
MRFRVLLLILLRLFILVISAGALGCHIAQIILLQQYANGTQGVSNWWPRYVPFILYYVGSGFSLLSSLGLTLQSMTNYQTVASDRFFSIVNAALLVAVVVYNSLRSGVIPWTNGTDSDAPSMFNQGWATYCSVYSNNTSMNRCWLINGAWLGSIVLAFLWIVLAFYVFIQTRQDIYENDYDSYDFKADVPMAMGSPVAPLRGHDGSGVQVSPAAYAAGTEYSNYNYYQYPDYYEDDAYRSGSPFRRSTGTPPSQSGPSNVRRSSGFNYPPPTAPTAAEKTAVPDMPVYDGHPHSEAPHSHDGSKA